MKHSLPVETLVRMGPEIIALGLEQIGRETLGAVAVVVSQGGGKGRHRDAEVHCGGHHVAPGRLGRDGYHLGWTAPRAD